MVALSFEGGLHPELLLHRPPHNLQKQNVISYNATNTMIRNRKQVLDIAKGSQERYMCVNLTNYHTVEFRIFRGTLKLNTLIATLQLLDRICDVAINLSDDELKDLSWTTFVAGCAHLPELVQYLKERRLYINEPVMAEAEV